MTASERAEAAHGDSLLEEQFTELLLRFRHRGTSLSAALEELRLLTRRPALIAEGELRGLLARIDQAHRAGQLRVHTGGAWTGAPTGLAIAALCAVSKGKVRAVRDAYYTLCLGLAPLNADEFTLSDPLPRARAGWVTTDNAEPRRGSRC
ncbi:MULTISPECIES: hypothetical protein [unclassified Crossiella]|uniref:hypothetical protein n=1 Tax=unclassified Crossiella TaxID=2620835 RepID=UPI001FFEA839|nr:MULTISPECIES: hypothetical protein [unclassified Crossiella]MCK2245283.1 hypothetical protein [Crossiella sp. S99.2]MCK2258935.1 hypothetical protein [Crossiella sp. S99.1]